MGAGPRERFRGGVRRHCRFLGGPLEGGVGTRWRCAWSRSNALCRFWGRAEQQQQQRERRADAAPVDTAFVCAGCRRPVGHTWSWVFSDEESGRILLRSASTGVAVEPERKVSKLPESADAEGRSRLDTAPGESGVPGEGAEDEPGKGPGALVCPREPLERLFGVVCTSRLWPKGEGFLPRTRSDGQGQRPQDEGRKPGKARSCS